MDARPGNEFYKVSQVGRHSYQSDVHEIKDCGVDKVAIKCTSNVAIYNTKSKGSL